MINILIIEDDINYCQKIINNLNQTNNNIRVFAILTDIDDIINTLSKGKIDIILLDIDLANKVYKQIKKYEKSIVLMLNIYYPKNKIKEFSNIFEYFYKNASIQEINNKIKKIIDLKSNNIKTEIQKELYYLGYNPKYNGTKYLIEAIYILYTKGNYIDDNLEKEIYPIIAKKHYKSINNIKCNIINATDTMVCECEENKLVEYLGFYNYSKPGPKKIIGTVLNKLHKRFDT